jgi:hypothetical protein
MYDMLFLKYMIWHVIERVATMIVPKRFYSISLKVSLWYLLTTQHIVLEWLFS